MSKTIYATYTDAIQREVVEPIEAGGIAKAGEYDIDIIASNVLRYDSINGREGFIPVCDHDEFWGIVSRNLIADMDEGCAADAIASNSDLGIEAVAQ